MRHRQQSRTVDAHVHVYTDIHIYTYIVYTYHMGDYCVLKTCASLQVVLDTASTLSAHDTGCSGHVGLYSSLVSFATFNPINLCAKVTSLNVQFVHVRSEWIRSTA